MVGALLTGVAFSILDTHASVAIAKVSGIVLLTVGCCLITSASYVYALAPGTEDTSLNIGREMLHYVFQMTSMSSLVLGTLLASVGFGLRQLDADMNHVGLAGIIVFTIAMFTQLYLRACVEPVVSRSPSRIDNSVPAEPRLSGTSGEYTSDLPVYPDENVLTPPPYDTLASTQCDVMPSDVALANDSLPELEAPPTYEEATSQTRGCETFMV